MDKEKGISELCNILHLKVDSSHLKHVSPAILHPVLRQMNDGARGNTRRCIFTLFVYYSKYVTRVTGTVNSVLILLLW